MRTPSILLLEFFAVFVSGSGIPSRPSASLTRATKVDLEARSTAPTPTTTIQPLASGLCGYVDGDPGQPFNCKIAGDCVIATNKSINAAGCCVSSHCPYFLTKCIPFSVSCDDTCQSSKSFLVCGQTDAPLCATYTYPGGYTDMRCVSSMPQNLNIEFTYDGFTTPLPLPRLATSLSNCAYSTGCDVALEIKVQTPLGSTSGSSSSRSSGSSRSSTKSSTNSARTSSSSQSSSGESQSSSSKKSSNAGPIAGGIVGGLAVLAAAGVAIFYFRLRIRRASKTESDYSVKAQSPSDRGKAELPSSPREIIRKSRPVELEQKAPLIELEANEAR